MSKLDFNKLSQVKLTHGQHDDPRSGGCAMDMVSWLEYGRAGDYPECVCPVIAAFIRTVNDFLPDNERQRLVPYLLRFSGTVSKEHEQQRAEYLAWQSITVFAPLALEAAGLKEEAEKLQNLDQNDLGAAEAAAEAAARAAEAAEAAAWAAWAAEAAARAAEAAARAAARAAAWAAARAAWAAARAAWAAARAAEKKLHDAVFKAIDGLLDIGPSGVVDLLPVEAPARLEKFLELQKERVLA